MELNEYILSKIAYIDMKLFHDFEENIFEVIKDDNIGDSILEKLELYIEYKSSKSYANNIQINKKIIILDKKNNFSNYISIDDLNKKEYTNLLIELNIPEFSNTLEKEDILEYLDNNKLVNITSPDLDIKDFNTETQAVSFTPNKSTKKELSFGFRGTARSEDWEQNKLMGANIALNPEKLQKELTTDKIDISKKEIQDALTPEYFHESVIFVEKTIELYQKNNTILDIEEYLQLLFFGHSLGADIAQFIYLTFADKFPLSKTVTYDGHNMAHLLDNVELEYSSKKDNMVNFQLQAESGAKEILSFLGKVLERISGKNSSNDKVLLIFKDYFNRIKNHDADQIHDSLVVYRAIANVFKDRLKEFNDIEKIEEMNIIIQEYGGVNKMINIIYYLNTGKELEEFEEIHSKLEVFEEIYQKLQNKEIKTKDVKEIYSELFGIELKDNPGFMEQTLDFVKSGAIGAKNLYKKSKSILSNQIAKIIKKLPKRDIEIIEVSKEVMSKNIPKEKTDKPSNSHNNKS